MRAFPCLAAVLASTLATDTQPSATPPAFVREAHTCQCIAGDRLYAQGEIACIRGQPMKCGMSLNTSSWIVMTGACAENRLSALSRSPRPSATVTPL